jgi:hypothetical protein
MEATIAGPNRTGTALARNEVELMLEAVETFSPPAAASTLSLDIARQAYITEAESVGSIPPPTGEVKAPKGKQQIAAPVVAVFLDKLGERLAFERTGVRLYDALISKYLALYNLNGEQSASERTATNGDGESLAPRGETALDTLRKIRADELRHFHLLSGCIEQMGGDPTAQTPCADVTATASAGIMQAITDPRTTFAQCLNTILTVELTDNAAWELLSELAVKAGRKDIAQQFETALADEAEHLQIVRGWLAALLTNDVGSPAV